MHPRASICLLTPRSAEAARFLKKTFREWDKNGIGTISQDDLANTLTRVGGFTPPQVKMLCQEVDKKGDGTVAYDDFVDWVMRPTSSVKLVDGEAKMFDWDDCFRSLFRVYDRNGDGTITFDEMKECHTILERAIKETMFDNNIKHTLGDVSIEFMKADKDNNEEVNFQEFVDWQKKAVEHCGLRNEEVAELINKLAQILSNLFEMSKEAAKGKTATRRKYPELRGLQKEIAGVERMLWSKKEPAALNFAGQCAGYTSTWTEPPDGLSIQQLLHEHMKVVLVALSDVESVDVSVPVCLPETNGDPENPIPDIRRRWLAKVVRKVTSKDGSLSSTTYFYAFTDDKWALQTTSQDFDMAEMDLAPALRLLCIFMTRADFRTDPMPWKATQEAFGVAKEMGLMTREESDKFNKFMADVATEMIQKFHGNSKSEEAIRIIVQDFLQTELTLAPLNIMAELSSLGVVRRFALWQDQESGEPDRPAEEKMPPVRRKDTRHATWHDPSVKGHAAPGLTSLVSAPLAPLRGFKATDDFDMDKVALHRGSGDSPPGSASSSSLPRIERGSASKGAVDRRARAIPKSRALERCTSLNVPAMERVSTSCSTSRARIPSDARVDRGRSPSPNVAADEDPAASSQQLPAFRRIERKRTTTKLTKFDKQVAALQGIVLDLGPSMELRELVGHLTRHVLACDGRKAFSDDKLDAAFLEAVGMSAQPLDENFSFSSATRGADAAEEPDAKLKKEAERSTKLLLVVLKALAAQTPQIMPLSEIIGQILWRNRCTKSLKSDKHDWIASDTSWMPNGDDVPEGYLDEQELEANISGNVVDHVATVFNIFTRNTGGRLRWRDIPKVTKMLQGNPVISARISTQRIDQLFFVEQRRDIATWNIGWNDFKVMLLCLAQAIECHPFLIFHAVASHAERLTSEMEKPPHEPLPRALTIGACS